MSELVDEFLQSLGASPKIEQQLLTAIQLLEVCRGYIDHHYKKSVYGAHQKNLLDMIDEFLIEIKNDKDKST